MSLRSEIFEQPTVLADLLRDQMECAKEIARSTQARGVPSVFVAARGTSDHAALYMKYVWGSVNRLPVALAAPSLFTLYERPPQLKNSLVVGISQSGQSPDIAAVVVEGRRQGALTLAVTDDPKSPLAEQADVVFDTQARPERAIAATKTYTTQLLAVAMISAAMAGDARRIESIESLPRLVEDALGLDQIIEPIAQRYRSMKECIVVGRGSNDATAREWALTLKELSHVCAEPYSTADFQHGPIAVVTSGFPVMAIAVSGPVLQDVISLLKRFVAEHGAELVAVSNDPETLDLARTPLPLANDLPEWLSPMVGIVPAQLFCYHLTRAKGYDTEKPRGLHKITRTW